MMKRVMSVLIVLALLMSGLTVFSVSAASKEEVYLLGDTDLDGEVAVTDATFIQRYDVKIIELSDKQVLTADVDGDGEISIIDATWIQRWDLQFDVTPESWT